MARAPRLIALALALAAIVAFVVFGLSSSHSTATGRRAPELPREHLAGPAVTLSSMLASAHGRATLVVFWASWCGPCMREAPAIERFSQSAEGRGRIVGVDWSDGLSGARAFIKDHGWTFANVRDAEGTVGNDYRMTDLPTTFVLDSSGRIRAALRGPQDASTLAKAMASVKPA
ncbi:MAG TPA: TlpA disulfide reductase family protein [Solirubrobacteraceae bacterium]|nr:TlpA disulfide reductase family protein [Solirubrobacteraceae bacterium]